MLELDSDSINNVSTAQAVHKHGFAYQSLGNGYFYQERADYRFALFGVHMSQEMTVFRRK